MWARISAARALARSRVCGVLAGVFLATAASATPIADARAVVGDLAGGAAGPALSPMPTQPVEPVDLAGARSLLAGGPRLALLEVAAPRLGGEGVPSTRRMVEPVVLDSPILSGLPWRSGAACGTADMEAWRGGRALDTTWFGVNNDSWAAMLKAAKGASLRSRAKRPGQLVVSVPLLPNEASLQHAQCAAGDFDGNFRAIGAALFASGAGGAVVRLGKEANRGAPPWGYDTAEEAPLYKACFRNAALALKGAAPNLKIEWTNARRTVPGLNPLDAYPGGDAVDIVGVHYYDNPRPARMTTQALWDAQYAETGPGGGPVGLGTWLAAAKALDKKLAVSEWGLWGPKAGPPDDVVYIENMYRFFKENAAALEYESYYNCALTHQLFPSTRFPNARARYQELWTAGQ